MIFFTNIRSYLFLVSIALITSKTSSFASKHRTNIRSLELKVAVNPVILETIRDIATGGTLSVAGDILAQSLTSFAKQEDKEENFPSVPPKDWDKVRTAAFGVFGGLYTGGAQHFVFGFLNNNFSDPIIRLLLAQFFFIPFCYYPTFLLMVPSLRAGWENTNYNFNSPVVSERRASLFGEVFSKIPKTLLRNWCFWLPVQFVQFSFVPMDLQVLYVAGFGIIWNAILSWSTSSSPTSSSDAFD